MGMGKHGDVFVIILDIDRVFSGDDLSGIGEPDRVAVND